MLSLRLFILSRLRRRGLPARLSSFLMLFQRSSLLKLLPEARILSTSGFTEALSFTATVVGGLGAFNSVSGVTSVVQQGNPSSFVVNMTGGSSGTFAFTIGGQVGTITPGTWVISGHIPNGLLHGDFKQSLSSFVSGTPTEVGSFPLSVALWEDVSGATGRNVSADFTINISAPPVPNITAHPQGGNFAEGAVVNLIATQTSGFNFEWKRDGEPLPPDSTVLAARTAPRRYRIAPSTDPGTAWRTGAAFDDSVSPPWISVSGGIGYDNNVNPPAVSYIPFIAPGGNTGTAMFGTGKPVSAHIRIPFTLAGSTPITNLKLRVQSDDGFVAWLNGTQIANQNPLANVLWNSPAGAQTTDANAIVFREIDVSRSIAALNATGQNLLAVQAQNFDPGSSDFLFNCELVGSVEAGSHTRRLIIPAINSNQAGTYTLTVTNPTGSVTSNPAAVVLPPQIETHPEDTTIASGQTATLTVEAIISPPWTYQWFRGPRGDTSQPVNGATQISFTTPPLTETTAYWVRVSNGAGSVNSNAATVTIMPAANAPQISAGPQSVTIDAGTATELSVTATGQAPLSFQWYTGTSGTTTGLITGATAATYTTEPLTATATYWVRVTSPGGSADSATATVSIRDPFLTWGMAQFTAAELTDPAITGPAADPDGDGTTNEQEYIFGTVPKNGQPGLTPTLSSDGQNVVLTFRATAAAGPGYTGRTRHYAIEMSNDLPSGLWVPIPAFSDVIGNNQEVSWNLSIGPNPKFCRLKVWLTP